LVTIVHSDDRLTQRTSRDKASIHPNIGHIADVYTIRDALLAAGYIV
jgi:hypothetical protein